MTPPRDSRATQIQRMCYGPFSGKHHYPQLMKRQFHTTHLYSRSPPGGQRHPSLGASQTASDQWPDALVNIDAKILCQVSVTQSQQ